MEEKFITNQTSEDVSDSVYVLNGPQNLNQSMYDVSHPDYVQVHCLRFEIDRSKGVKEGGRVSGVKITDVDFWLEGNRHARAN